MPNGIEWATVALAAMRVGAVLVRDVEGLDERLVLVAREALLVDRAAYTPDYTLYFPAERVRPLGITMILAMTLVKRIDVGSAEALRAADLRLPRGA